MEANESVVADNNAITTVNDFNIVNVDDAKAFMDNYQDLVEALLDPTDYQKIGGKKFKKKSAWRKLATAFNITDEVVKEDIVRDDNYGIISAKYYVKATLLNGRSSVGVGVCSIFDKITKKDSEQPSNFVLRNRFNNAEHDVPSTAHTRAKNRAIADLIGAGEVTADEMSDGYEKKTIKPKVKPKKVTKPVVDDKPDDVIEVEVVSDKKSHSLKDLMELNSDIKSVVHELDDECQIVNFNAVKDRLLLKHKSGVLNEDDYSKAIELIDG